MQNKLKTEKKDTSKRSFTKVDETQFDEVDSLDSLCAIRTYSWTSAVKQATDLAYDIIYIYSIPSLPVCWQRIFISTSNDVIISEHFLLTNIHIHKSNRLYLSKRRFSNLYPIYTAPTPFTLVASAAYINGSVYH
ncbi:hypothetical protein Tcan_00767, partial [Toxocara canis]